MPFDESKFRPAVTPSPGYTPPPRSTTPTINAPSDDYDWRAIGAGLLRGAGGFAPPLLPGAVINFLTEAGAQSLGKEPYNLASMAGSAALGAVPFGKAVSLAKSAGKGALLGASGTALRQQTEEGLHLPSEEEGKEIAIGGGLGLLGGGVAHAVGSKFDLSKFKKATPVEKAAKEVSEAVAQAAETKVPTKVDAQTSTKTDPSQLPKELSKLKFTYKGTTPSFSNDIDKALFIITAKDKHPKYDEYISWLGKQTGLKEKDLTTAAKVTKEKLRLYLKDMPVVDGEVALPKLNNLRLKSPSAKAAEVDIVTGRPITENLKEAVENVRSNPKGNRLPEVRLPTDVEAPPIKPPTVEVPTTSTGPQVDLQTASPEVKLGDLETPASLTQLQQWKKNPIRKLAAEARQLQTGLDLSFPLRQGITNITRKEFRDSMIPMLKSAWKEENFQKFQKEVIDDPLFELMEKSGVHFGELGKNAKIPEEAISKDTLIEQFGFAGIKPIRMSNRAYTAFANKLRKDLFKSMSDDAQKAGVNLIDEKGNASENAKAIARYINDSTGRGHLGRFEKSASELNDVLFSPKLMASRVNMFRRAFQDPSMLKNGVDTALAKQLRKRAIRDMLGVGGLAATAITTSELSGAEGTLDPRSTDFGKLKIGNTRLDLTGGFQQYVRVAAQLATGMSGSFDDAKDTNRKNVAERFGRNKLSPLAGLIVDWMADKNVLGDKFTWNQAAKDRIIPLIIQDIQEVYQEDPKMLPFTMPASMFGVGVQSYGNETQSGGGGIFKMGKSSGFKMPKIKLP